MDKNVVVIEDDRDILDMIRYILADEGYNVTGYNGLEPLETIAAQQPTVILLDYKLTNGFGSTLCSALKSNQATKRTPVVLVSASGRLDDLAHQCGADAFLPKPFDLADLVKIVNHFAEPSSVN